MAIKTFTAKEVFLSGRGNVSGNLAKSDSEVMHEEAELVQDGMEPVGKGGAVLDHGNMPVFTAGSKPFHEGRGLGRGHGPETK